MINLIPNEEKKKMVHDFYMRVAAMFFFMLGGSALLASAALLPAYFFAGEKRSSIDDKLQAQQNDPVPTVDQRTSAIITEVNRKIAVVEADQKNQFLVSQKVINQILVNKMPDIKLTDITYENNTERGKKIGINGTAPSRERLLMFRKALEDDPSFKKVDLPISNFIKGSNIEFYLTLIPS
jgi:hypothetical protein